MKQPRYVVYDPVREMILFVSAIFWDASGEIELIQAYLTNQNEGDPHEYSFDEVILMELQKKDDKHLQSGDKCHIDNMANSPYNRNTINK